MRKGFVDSIKSVDGGRIQLEHRDLGLRVGLVDLGKPRVGVGHTMEVGHIDIDWGGTPTFALGPHRGGTRPVLQQLIPLGYMATALRNGPEVIETNRWAILQVELAGYSSLDPWLPDEPTQVVYASLMEFAQQELGVVEARPFPDTLEPGKVWATNNSRRQAGMWGNFSGWFKHCEVPDQSPSWHWDDGSMQHRVLLRQERGPRMVTAFQLVMTYGHKHDVGDVHRHNVRLSPHFRRKADLRKWIVLKGEVRRKVWQALQGRIWEPDARRWIEVSRSRLRVAERKVDERHVT